MIKTVAAPQKAAPSQLELYNALNRELSALLPYKALASKSSLEESVEVQDRGRKFVWDFEEIVFCSNTQFQIIFYIHMFFFSFFFFQKQTSEVFVLFLIKSMHEDALHNIIYLSHLVNYLMYGLT